MTVTVRAAYVWPMGRFLADASVRHGYVTT